MKKLLIILVLLISFNSSAQILLGTAAAYDFTEQKVVHKVDLAYVYREMGVVMVTSQANLLQVKAGMIMRLCKKSGKSQLIPYVGYSHELAEIKNLAVVAGMTYRYRIRGYWLYTDVNTANTRVFASAGIIVSLTKAFL